MFGLLKKIANKAIITIKISNAAVHACIWAGYDTKVTFAFVTKRWNFCKQRSEPTVLKVKREWSTVFAINDTHR